MFLIADNVQVTRKVVGRAFEERDPGPVAEIAARCAAAKVDAVDVNMGPVSRDPEGAAEFFVTAVLSGARLPLWIDTVNPRAMERGLVLAKAAGRPAINGVSLAPERLEAMAELSVRHDADLVAYLLTEKGMVCPDADTRLAVAAELWTRLCGLGVSPERVIVDPVCAPLLWGDGVYQSGEVANTIRLLPDVLGFPVKTVVGLSNLTTGRAPRDRKERYEAAYLCMLASAGLSHALVNVEHGEVLTYAGVVGNLRSGRVFSWE
ncbi:MAG: dihydropteroate synthase [Thermodesulfobacteriota bacterium]